MNHAYFCHGGCRAGYKLQFDFSKSTGRGAGKERERRVSNREKKKRWRRRASASRLGFLSVSAGYQLAIRALIAFECNVAENFIWARQHEGARAGMRWDRGREEGDRHGRVDPAVTLSRLCGPPAESLLSPFRRDICISAALSQMQSRQRASARHDDRISLRRWESRHYDSRGAFLVRVLLIKSSFSPRERSNTLL